ncbi:uncharacterized protein LY79DRAFT_655473 [Colletotrichum navitas]|uniref:Uncharacterized protein n=1 Tax=Colletotrichum navitas TaxID=681940 RepID=A0AAD8VCR8_9PEZI|nr:uncharacterized protein LY79DRAFT_655473 [Colletotrichum navitas]KAK1599825.1 hypothetical protein LY79DRAFT_655473 [Colletotrichum navitas]
MQPEDSIRSERSMVSIRIGVSPRISAGLSRSQSGRLLSGNSFPLWLDAIPPNDKTSSEVLLVGKMETSMRRVAGLPGFPAVSFVSTLGERLGEDLPVHASSESPGDLSKAALRVRQPLVDERKLAEECPHLLAYGIEGIASCKKENWALKKS